MKKTLLFAVLLFSTTAVFSQSEKYMKAMQQWVPAVDTTHSPDALLQLANTFQRIADAEKTQWLPYYYAALCQVNWAYMTIGETPSTAVVDPVAEKASTLLGKAQSLTAENSELLCLKKMIASLRMWADPMGRYMTDGATAVDALKKAKEMDADNPRVYMLEGQDKFYTPEQFGGSKTEAKALFETAMKKFEIHQPASPIHPSWGRSNVQYFLSQF
jgi:hypothetical protein